MRIIAFGHRQDVGKSTAARFLIGELRIRNPNIRVVQANFSDKVKTVAYDLYAWSGLQPGHYYEDNYHLKNITLPLIGKSPRELWIGVGNSIRTIYDPTWSDYLFKTVHADVLVIGDMRFPTEANAVVATGGCIYRIDRDSAKKITDSADDPLADYTGWTGIIPNNTTLGDFHKEIMKLC